MAGDLWTVWAPNVITGLVGTLVGAGIAWVLYKRAGDELRHESKQLRRLISMTLSALEQHGLTKLNRDAEGNIVGFIFEHVASGGIKFGGSAKVEFIPGKTPEANR